MWEAIRVWLGADGQQKVSRPYPLFTQQVDVSGDASTVSADYSTNPLRGIYVGGAGSVYIKASEDAAFFEWDVLKGAHIPGLIFAVQAAPTATKLVGYR